MNALHTLVQRIAPSAGNVRVGPIGLDIGRHAARLIQFAGPPDGPRQVVAAGAIDFDASDDRLATLDATLGETVRRLGLRGRRVVAAMPAGDYRLLQIAYRPTPEKSDEAAIIEQVADRLDGALSDYVIDAVPVRSAAREAETQALVAVSRRDDVTALLRCLARHRLNPDVVEIAPLALRRLVGELAGTYDGLNLIVNTGMERSYLTLLHGRRLLLDQVIEFGETPLVNALAQTLSLSYEHAHSLVLRTGLRHGGADPIPDHREGETGMFNTLLEILRPRLTRLVDHTDSVFMYAAAQTRGGGDAQILLFGALARWPGCAEVISDMTRLPVVVPSMDNLAAANRLDLSMPDYAVAAGLALRGITHDT
ncbi:MAG: pilus assembly protein PilM [Pseudomonadota bacterium]